jgi:FlaA1/EpsC-like NDP-sugar epimerase
MVGYLMTIQEAAQLVLQASSLGARSEIFVLAMGEPVRIVDLADRMIRLMGYTPGSEIAIEFTGARPGEKLYEELSTTEEETAPTSHPKIFVFKDTAMRNGSVLAQVEELKAACENRQALKALRILQTMVPDYTPSKDLLRTVAVLDAVSTQVELGVLTPMRGTLQ